MKLTVCSNLISFLKQRAALILITIISFSHLCQATRGGKESSKASIPFRPSSSLAPTFFDIDVDDSGVNATSELPAFQILQVHTLFLYFVSMVEELGCLNIWDYRRGALYDCGFMEIVTNSFFPKSSL